MDDLVVIILTLIIAGIGAFGQIKKKKQPQPVQEDEQNNSSDNFWDVLEEFGVQAQQSKAEFIEEDTIKEPVKTDFPQEEKKKYAFIAENEGQTSISKEASIANEIKQEIQKERKGKLSDTFSLRKAVIYSEILNRKYS